MKIIKLIIMFLISCLYLGFVVKVGYELGIKFTEIMLKINPNDIIAMFSGLGLALLFALLIAGLMLGFIWLLGKFVDLLLNENK